MPTLIVEQPGSRTGGLITGRVLIGRLPTNGIVVADSSVSRLHAWIDVDPDQNFYVADSGSLTGTWVNGRAIAKRRLLADGDVIRAGQAQVVFSLDDELPDQVEWIDLAGLPPSDNIADAGVLFTCPCGAPVWFKAAAIGQAHVCRHCGSTILIPERTGAVAETIHAPPIAEPGVPTAAMPAGSPPDQHDALIDHTFARSTAAPVDDNGLAESPAAAESGPLFEHGITEEVHAPAEPHAPLFAESTTPAPLPIPEPESSPLFERAPAMHADPVSADLTAALQTHGEYSVEPPANGDSLQAFGFSPPEEFHDAGDAAPADDAAAREPLFEHATVAPHAEASAIPEPVPADALTLRDSAAVTIAATPAPADDADLIPIEELIAPHTVEHTCSICHTAIASGETSTACPACGLTFHADCWQENLGCSAYGCSQVGALQPAEPEAIGAAATDSLSDTLLPADDDELEVASFPWESLFLVVSVIGSLMGALAYGVPALIGAAGTAIYLAAFQESRKRRIVAVVALLVCMLGAGGGVYVSYLWWNGWPMSPALAHRGGTP